MVSNGLSLSNFEGALGLLRRLNASAESARAALSEFIEIEGIDPSYFEIGIQEIYDKPFFELPIFPLEGALEILSELSGIHQLALVTVGKEVLQMEKLKKAGIDSSLFSKIAISEQRDKKLHYQRIVEQLGYSPSEVVVCGDRVSVDLLPARELGFKTIHMQWGRGAIQPSSQEGIDYQITALHEVKGIINSLSARTL